ncbi:hypothetical protein GHK92_06335 [Nocardioides sp. dk4132]|uniref:hypothetical protein n=1 Tax=unclassified Nocardioides TaxID=2615069 RepID=UPI0012958FB0|nr:MULTISPECIES: hypothetical protein [unclassified Nocardioides]MQW75484.1 hypothetical protein [Nocardioides sp. dk4132]QGA08402.1 hypothetical protein GFH29_14080 [Nocardioides sp. dk884]
MPRRLSTAASVRRRLALGAAALTSLAAAGTVLAPPAQAAWTTGAKANGVKVQVCKVPLTGGDVRVRVRLDNRASSQVYRGSLERLTGGSGSVTVRAAGGTISGTKSLVVKPGHLMGTGISGPGVDHGSAIGYARSLARC